MLETYITCLIEKREKNGGIAIAIQTLEGITNVIIRKLTIKQNWKKLKKKKDHAISHNLIKNKFKTTILKLIQT